VRTAIRAVGTLALLGVLAQSAGAQDKPNFSGTWKMDPAQTVGGGGFGGGGGGGGAGGGGARPAGGGGMGGGAAQEISIAQDASSLKITMMAQGAERVMTYAIGGATSKNPMGGRMAGEMSSTTVWEGMTLMTHGTASISTPNGDMQITSHEVRSLSADGKSMTVETTTTTGMGENTRKQVYIKQ